jgi:hypothetical protein
VGHDKTFVDQLAEVSVEARTLLRDIYVAMKEARKVIKELNVAVEQTVAANVTQEVERAMKAGLDELGIATRKAMDDSVAKVSREFDALTELMMTGNKHGRSQDGFDLRDFVKKKT